MNLLCVTRNDLFADYLATGLEPYGIAVSVVDDLAQTSQLNPELEGMLVTSSCIDELGVLPDRKFLPVFLCVDKLNVVNVSDLKFSAVFTKFFSLEEIAATLKFHLYSLGNFVGKDVLCYEDIEMNLLSRSIKRSGRTINLSNKEFRLLEFLLKNPKRVLRRDEILENVWDQNAFSITNTIEVHIRNLRKKLDYPFENKLIRTIHCVGYSFG